MKNSPLRLWRVALWCMLATLLTGAISAQAPPDPLSAPARWDGESRFTVLVMGVDRRPVEGDLFMARADALLLVSVDPSTDRIGVLHIPRDLHVAVPELDPLIRVNTLLRRGELLQEGYGAYHLLDVLSYNFGMYIDAFVLFDFEGFIGVVDAMGGVEIMLDYTISDPTYPDMDFGYDPFYLPAGRQILDGATALKFARTRHGANDYIRGARQVQLLKAIAEKATRPDVLPRLILNTPTLLYELSQNVVTDLGFEDALTLARYTGEMSLDDVKAGGINEAYISYHFQEGASVATIDRTKIADLLSDIFGENYGE